jgi:hypothetical protein
VPETDLLHVELHLVMIVGGEIAPDDQPVVGLVPPVRRARAVVERRHGVLALLRAIELRRVADDPDVDATGAGEHPHPLEHVGHVLRLVHRRRLHRLELVPGIDHEAADAGAEAELATDSENPLDLPVVLVARHHPGEVLRHPRERRLELGRAHARRRARVKGLADVLLGDRRHVVLQRQVLRREDRECPPMEPREVHAERVEPVRLPARRDAGDHRELAGPHGVEPIQRRPAGADAALEAVRVEAQEVLAAVIDADGAHDRERLGVFEVPAELFRVVLAQHVVRVLAALRPAHARTPLGAQATGQLGLEALAASLSAART